jgi:hypothetical protein
VFSLRRIAEVIGKTPTYEANKAPKETIKVLREEFGDDAAIILSQIVRIEF